NGCRLQASARSLRASRRSGASRRDPQRRVRLLLRAWRLSHDAATDRRGSAGIRTSAESFGTPCEPPLGRDHGHALRRVSRGEVPGVPAHAEGIVELADRHRLGCWRVNGLSLRGWAMVRRGATEAGIALMCQNAADRAALGGGWYQARYLCMLAAAYAQVGQA